MMPAALHQLDACEDLPELPQVIQALRDALGWSVTLQLVEVFGGTMLYVPSAYSPDLALVRLIGPASAVTLIEVFRGEPLDIPRMLGPARAMRDREIVRKYRAGYTVRQLAREYHLTWRWIFEILRRAGEADERQGSLFGEP